MKREIVLLALAALSTSRTLAEQPPQARLLPLVRAAIRDRAIRDLHIPVIPLLEQVPSGLSFARSYRITPAETAYEMRCEPRSACLPFIAIATGAAPERTLEATTPQAPLHKRGDIVVLELRGPNYRGSLFGICGQNANLGDRITIRSLDKKQKFTAKVQRRGLAVVTEGEP